MTKTSTSVLIVGGGPCGLYLALRLASATPPIPVTVIEAQPTLDDTPKAVVHMPTMYPEYKRSGIYADVFATAGQHTSGAVAFRRVSDRAVLERIDPLPGRPGPLVLRQDQFCGVLHRRFVAVQETNPHARLLMGHRVERIDMPEDGDGDVTVTVRRVADGEETTFTATYLVGADGSNSLVRSACGLKYEGSSLPYKLVAADVTFPLAHSPAASGWAGANFMCDGADYGHVAEMFEDETHATWRVSCGFPDTFTDEEIAEGIHRKFDRMLPGPRPLEYTVRYQPYKLHQLCATQFRKGRAFLVGDAAHLANPYSGQLLSCGIFDASSLGDCLVSVLHSTSPPEPLLTSWATARKEKFTKVMDPLSRACFGAVNNPDPDTVAQRHPFLKAMKAAQSGNAKPPPSLATDVATLEGWVNGAEQAQLVTNEPGITLVWGSEEA